MNGYGFHEPNRNIDAAWPDYLAERMGIREARDPCAREMLDRSMTLGDVWGHWIGASRHESLAAKVDRGMGADDLKQSMITGIGGLTTQQFNIVITWLWNIVRRIPVRTFKPFRSQTLSSDGFGLVPEHAQIPYSGVRVDDGLESARVETLGTLRNLSRQAIINDDVGVLNAQIDDTVNAANLQILSSVASAFEATDALADGLAFFNSTSGNLIGTGAYPSITSLDEITAKMYRMARPLGGISAALPRFILCPPELLGTVRTLMLATFDKPETVGTGGVATNGGVGYAVLPFSDTRAWYAVADPKLVPAMGMLVLQGSASPLTIESRPTPANRDGISWRAMLDYKVIRLSRHAAAKNPGAAA